MEFWLVSGLLVACVGLLACVVIMGWTERELNATKSAAAGHRQAWVNAENKLVKLLSDYADLEKLYADLQARNAEQKQTIKEQQDAIVNLKQIRDKAAIDLLNSINETRQLREENCKLSGYDKRAAGEINRLRTALNESTKERNLYLARYEKLDDEADELKIEINRLRAALSKSQTENVRQRHEIEILESRTKQEAIPSYQVNRVFYAVKELNDFLSRWSPPTEQDPAKKDDDTAGSRADGDYIYVAGGRVIPRHRPDDMERGNKS